MRALTLATVSRMRKLMALEKLHTCDNVCVYRPLSVALSSGVGLVTFGIATPNDAKLYSSVTG